MTKLRGILRRRERGRPTGSSSVLIVLSRLGMRAGEVARLRLDDIRWRAGRSRSRGKGGRCDRLPAGGISRCARSRPIATAPLTATDRSDSANGISPRLTRSTISGFTSTPVTSSPPVASETVVGSPM